MWLLWNKKLYAADWGKGLESYTVKGTFMTNAGPYLKGNLTLSMDMPMDFVVVVFFNGIIFEWKLLVQTMEIKFMILILF